MGTQVPSFFSSFQTFTPDPSASTTSEFARLAQHMQWKPGSKKYREMKAECFSLEFSTHYGTDATKLENWQGLCAELGITEDVGSITKCRKALSKIFVNIMDLVDSRRTGIPVKQFRTYNEFRRYMHSERRFYPRDLAKEDGFLKALLKRLR